MEQLRTSIRRAVLLAWSAALVLTLAAPADALDPNRALTQYLHRIWQTPQGLPQGTIRSIHQTKDGYLWLGTDQGLVRFDGVRFTSFFDTPVKPAQELWVRQMVEDTHRDLWIATANTGLLYFHDGALARFLGNSALPSQTVYCVLSSQDGDLWACTQNGVVRIHEGQVRTVASGRFEAACQRQDGTIWAGGDGPRLTVWKGTSQSTLALHSLPEYATVQALLAARDGSLWIGTSEGLLHLAQGEEHLYTKSEGLSNNSVLTLNESQDGSIWIGTNDGFSRWRGRELESFGTRNGLSQSTVYSIQEDREGSLWVGTKRGLNQFLDRRTIPITTSEGLPSNDTGPVLQDEQGMMWVGTIGAGLSRYDGRHTEILTTRDGLSSNSIYAFAVDAQGDLWAGTDKGLDLLHNGKVVRTLTTARGLPSNMILSLHADGNGSLWVGTAAGLAVFRNGEVRTIDQRPASRLPVLALGEAGGRVFASQTGGVRVFSLQTAAELHDQELALRDVDAFYTDKDGLVWMGTLGGGLNLLDGDKLAHFSMKDGLFDDDIFGIAGDSKGDLWMACSKGIFSVNRSDLRRFAAGSRQAIVSTPYSPLDGLQTVECKSGVQPAAWETRNGHVSFSTIRGLLVIDPTHIEPKLAPPPVVIEAVTVDGRTVRQLTGLAAGERNLAFSYTGLSFRSPTHISFRYKLEGFDHDWIDAGTRREAFYTNLPPGNNYRFRVTACNYDGSCDDTGASVAFSLPARFYQRTWFWPLVALLIAVLARLAYGVRIKHLKYQFDIVLAERSRIARELHDTLIQGFSGVTMEMQALAARLASEHRRTLEDIIQDSAHCLREARRSVADLRRVHAPQSGLAAAIANGAKQCIGATGARLKLNLEPAPEGLPAFIEHNLVRIAQEAVTNSVKHSGARTIEVMLRSTPDTVRLSVQDDGTGFAGVDASNPKGEHYGLIGMKERARDIGAEFRLATEPGSGTTVSVALPIPKSDNGFRHWNVRNLKSEI